MKTWRQWRAGVTLIVALLGCGNEAYADTIAADWQFTSNANPTVPTQQTNVVGGASATVSVGYLGSGWLASLDGFGNQTGLWDLGFENTEQPTLDTRGRVALELLNSGATNSARTDLKLRVVQFVDGFMYKGGLALSIPDAHYVGQTVVEKVPGGLGGSWVEDEYQWQLSPSRSQISLCLTGAVSGTLIDRVRVDVENPSPAVPEILITLFERQGSVLALEWTGGKSPYEILSATNLLGETDWSRVGAEIFGTKAQIPLDGVVGYVRVRGSN